MSVEKKKYKVYVPIYRNEQIDDASIRASPM